MVLTFRHDEHRHRYTLLDDGESVAYADYRLTNGDTVADFHHTCTLRAHRRKGFAAEVVARALADVRAAGRRVVPTCWYVDDYLRDHPDVADLRA